MPQYMQQMGGRQLSIFDESSTLSVSAAPTPCRELGLLSQFPYSAIFLIFS